MPGKEEKMDFFDILAMVGGLALFLYGMNTMGEGLAKLSGGKLERILEKLTSKRIMAVLLGAGVTAIIQSSSATTVMVVGFVNSGIMRLNQAIGVIMGANIGTTITSWILSLTGIEGESFFIQMLKPSSFTPILALIGAAFLLFAKKEKKKDLGTIFLGFAVLMFGMESMSDAVSGLQKVEGFKNILLMFSNPILGMIAGTVLTALIQSSSASVGILQALCATGAVTYGTALPIIMGQNIGTCITAVLAAIGTSKNAKRAAAVHLSFNVIGTVLFMIIFYTINAFFPFAFLEDAAGEVGIAIIHTSFNILATLVLFPCAGLLEKLACHIVPDSKEEEKENEFELLDERFLERPAFAISQAMVVTEKMARLSEETLKKSSELIFGYDEKKFQDVCALEDKVDEYEDKLGTYLVKLGNHYLNHGDSQELSVLLHCIGDFERISDHAVNIAYATKEMAEKKLNFSEKALEELTVFKSAVDDIMADTVEVFAKKDLNKAKNIEPLEETIDYINSEIKKRHIKRLRKGKCTIELGFILSDITTAFERISDHCSNIAVCILQISEDMFDTHEYMDVMKAEDNLAFAEAVKLNQKRYVLPGKKKQAEE